MSTLYISRVFLALACVTLSACGGDNGAAVDSTTLVSSVTVGGKSLAINTHVPEAAASPTFISCATENSTCNFDGEAQVRYGTSTEFVLRKVSGPVSCSNSVFGDPAFGKVKSCSVEVKKVWTQCAVEGNICAFNGSKEVSYGTDTKYVTQTITGPVSCTNTTFGDPAPNYVKSCKVAEVMVVPIWTECAIEGNTCSVSGTVEVRYGAGSSYINKLVTGPFSCNNTTFGDPAPGQVKSCQVSAVTSPATPSPQIPIAISTPTPSVIPAPSPVDGAITTVQLISSASTSQSNVSATFGQSFVQGDVPRDSNLKGKLSNGTVVPLQVDSKVRHADGSLRHAIITIQLPSLGAKQVETIGLVRESTVSPSASITPASLLANGFSSSFSATIGGVSYTTSADELLKSGKYKTWLSGPLAHEWMVAAPLKTLAGVEHPHLHARFAIRFYPGSSNARVDVTVENGWAHVAMPSNFTYDAQILVGGQQVFTQSTLTHYSHARWRKIFWWGNTPKVDVRHATAYLIASNAVPNYDQSLTIKEESIAYWNSRWSSSNKAPMQAGVGLPYMPTTGARADIGPMPAWNALYLLSMDQRMKDIALGMSDMAGSWGTHFRNKVTDRPVNLADFPYMSFSQNMVNPATGKSESLPECPDVRCASPLTPDTAHQPAFSYLPYLVTGDYYHLEELQFWANLNSFLPHPDERYRDGGKGLVKADQVRGQAWSLRTLAEAAYITPDNDPQKANLIAILNNNIDWYTSTFPNNANANKLGVLDHYDHVGYMGGLGVAPWQDDFFTTSIGRLVELGFSRAEPLFAWKSKFVVDRMVGAGYCWVQASQYSLKVRDTTTASLYKSIAEVYRANNTTAFTQLACASSDMASSLGLRPGEMVGEFTPTGSQAIMQPALAYSARLNSNAASAWARFAQRPYQPNMAIEPQYAIVPR